MYGVAGLAVPAFGIITAARLDVLGEAWVIAAMVLTLAAALLLALLIVPAQHQVLRTGEPHDRTLRRLSGTTGGFSLLWAVVLVLMVFGPGSTLGA